LIYLKRFIMRYSPGKKKRKREEVLEAKRWE